MSFYVQSEHHWRGVGDLRRWLRHEVAFGTAWRDESPDQALRVAAGFHGSMRLSGWSRVVPTDKGCEAFPVMKQTWQPQAGGALESMDMVKLIERSQASSR